MAVKTLRNPSSSKSSSGRSWLQDLPSSSSCFSATQCVTSVPLILAVTSSKDFEVVWGEERLFPSVHRPLLEYFRMKMTELDSINPPTTTLSSPPTTNPVPTPPINTAPGIITVPATNSVNSPVTNPVNPPAPVTNPVTPPSAASGGNGHWCVAKNGASQAALQLALDYACGIGGADCATIQLGSSCYEPATLQNHASYAFNSYYQKNPAPTSCDFGGAAVITIANPSIGTCVYPSSSSSSPPTTQAPVNPTSVPTPPTTQTPVNPTSVPTPPTTQTPVNPTSLPTAPTTSSSGPTFPGTPPAPPGNPDPTGLGAFGSSPPVMNTAAASNNLLGSLVIVASIIILGL